MDNAPKVKTRFPPSPTGDLHLGGARTALFNWLFARHHGGEFVLRLEDTDRKRSKQEYVDAIFQAMDWLGLDWDEGPYYQTKRMERYREVIDGMLQKGRAYWCHCSPEEVQAQRDAAMKLGKKPMYDGTCRDKNLGPAEGAVVRYKGPQTGTTGFKDEVKGYIEFDNTELDDLIILRSDGTPTYQLAVVVDDVDMGITHVIRGDDHVNNTPRQIQLYEAMDAPLPVFAHVPMILGPDKKKLSKRHGATNVVQYREMGYLPEAMLNALARLGWSHGDQEIFSRKELIAAFDLDACGKSAAVFDQDKLVHLNQHYIQNAAPEHLAALARPFLAERGIEGYDEAVLMAALPYLTPRAKDLKELADWAEPYLLDEPGMDPKAVKKFLKPANVNILERILGMVKEKGVDDAQALEDAFHSLGEELEVKLGALAQPTRVSLTGRTFSPGIFEVMQILGAQKVTERLEHAIALAKSRS